MKNKKVVAIIITIVAFVVIPINGNFFGKKSLSKEVRILTNNYSLLVKGAGVEIQNNKGVILKKFSKEKWGSECLLFAIDIDEGSKITIIRKIDENFVKNIFLVPELSTYEYYEEKSKERRLRFLVTKDNVPQLQLLKCSNNFTFDSCKLQLLILETKQK